jgi:hypothetical protein
MADKKFIDGLPADGLNKPLSEGDRTSGTTDWLQFRSYWGEHPQRNEVRILDDDITLTDSFGVDGRVRGGKLPKTGGGARPNDFKAGMLGGLVVGVLAVLVGGFAVTLNFLSVQTFEYPPETGNWMDVGVATGSAITWILAFAGLMLAGVAVRSFLKDRPMARSADIAVAVLSVVMVALSLSTVGPGKLSPTLDLIPGWSDKVTESSKARISEYIVGPIDADDSAAPLTTKDGKGIPYRKAIIGLDRCGERDDKGRRSEKCAGMEQIVAEATAELDKVAAEVKQTDMQTCLVSKAVAQEYIKLRQDKKKAELPACEVSEQKHRVMTGLNGKFKKVQLGTWGRERDGLINSLIETRLTLAKRKYALEAAKALKAKAEHEVAEDAVSKIRKAWRTAAEGAFASTDNKSTTAVGYDGGVLCRWVQPSEDAIKAAKKERKPKPEPTASCGKAKRSHAEFKAYTSEADYQKFKVSYGALTEKLMDRPADPNAKKKAVDPNKPVIPTLLVGDQRSIQIVGLDVAEGLELGAKDQKLLVDGVTRRMNEQKGRVFSAVVSGEMGVPANVRPFFFIESKQWGKAMGKAEKAKKASGELGITCEEDENDKEGNWICKRPEYGESFKGAGADLVALMRLFKHETNGLTLGLRIIDKKDGVSLYKDGNAIADLKKIGKDAGPLFDRVVLAWAMKEQRLADERARTAVSQEVMRLRDRVSQSQSDNGRIEGAYNHIASTLLPFISGAAKDLMAIVADQGAATATSPTGQYKIERNNGYGWVGMALVLCLLALGVNFGTREVSGKDLAKVGAGGQIDLSGVDLARAAVWDGNSVLTGDGLGDRRSGSGLTLRSGEVVAFRYGGAAYTVRYISNSLDTPPGEFQEEIPTAEMLADVHPDFTPNPTIAAGLMEKDLADADKPQPQSKQLQVQLFWGHDLFDTFAFKMDQKVVEIGATPKADISISHSVFGDETAHYHLADNDGNQHELNVPNGANFEANIDGKVMDMEALRGAGRLSGNKFRLNDNEVAAMKVGAITLVFRYVKEHQLPVVPMADRLDWLFANIATISLLLHIAFIIILMLTPADPSRLSEDLFKNPNRFVKLILKEPEKKEKKKEKLDLSGAKDGGKHKDKEGKFGKKDKPKKDALASKKGAPTVDPNKRERDRKIAFKAGLLGLTGAATAVSNVSGPGGLGTGINNALGGLKGSEFGDAGGAGGLGYRGTGGGGGGNALGIGGLGSGTGRGTGGAGSIDLGGRGKGTTRIIPGRTVIKGSLSKEEIARVIRRHLNQIKYCYEKELTKKPNLRGKITSRFIIAGTGRVQMAKVYQTTMGYAPTEKCIVRIIKMMRFPQPRGGGIVSVTYPFMFQKAGR